MKLDKEENAFEDEVIAKEWIQAIETEKDGSRDLEMYPMLKKWSHDLAPQIILEIGSGQGICSSVIEITGKYIGIEPSKYLIDRAKELYNANNKEFLQGDSYQIPLSDESIDAAFSVGVWFHIENLDKAHQELYRVIKPQGEILIVTSNPDTHLLWENWFDNPTKHGKKIIGKVFVPTGVMSKNIFYMHSELEIVSSLEKNGFNIKSIKKFGHGKEKKRSDGIWMVINAKK